MSESTYKLHVRLGNHEFSGEGPEQAVERAYQSFLASIGNVADPQKTPSSIETPITPPEGPNGGTLDAALIERVFQKDGEILSLRLLPQGESTVRAGAAAIILLYGYRKLMGLSDVPVMKLTNGLRTSGVSVVRVDTILNQHNGLFMKGGTRAGGRFTLNNQGMAQAEKWISEWFR